MLKWISLFLLIQFASYKRSEIFIIENWNRHICTQIKSKMDMRTFLLSPLVYISSAINYPQHWLFFFCNLLFLSLYQFVLSFTYLYQTSFETYTLDIQPYILSTTGINPEMLRIVIKSITSITLTPVLNLYLFYRPFKGCTAKSILAEFEHRISCAISLYIAYKDTLNSIM